MQHEYIRAQLRLSQDLHERANKAASATNLSLNELFLKAIHQGLLHMAQQRRRLIYTQWITKHDSKSYDDYLLKAADGITDFLQRNPGYELVTVESLPYGLRCWYTYPVDEHGKEVPYIIEQEN